MDHELIYAKTAAGERAMLERTRTMPRNVRMVLILVDSRSSVGDLCLKTGNPQMTESALRELEIGGFIELHRHDDSLWDAEERLAREIRASANHKKAKQKKTLTAQKSESVASDTPSVEAIAAAPSAAPIAPQGQPQAQPEVPSEVQSSAPPPAPTQVQSIAALAVEPPLPIGKRFKELFSKPPGESISDEPVYAAPTSLSHPEPPEPPEPPVTPAIKVRARGRRSALAWPAIAALALVITVAALALTVALFPYARYIPELEAAMASACKRPVRIATLGVDLYPKPALRLGDVRVGDGNTLLRMAGLRLEPMPGSLLSAKMAFSSAVVSGVSLPAETVVGLPGFFSDLAQAGLGTTVARWAVEGAQISLGGVEFPPMSGVVELNAEAQFVSLRLTSPEKTLTLVLNPLLEGAKVTGLNVVAEAIGWRPAEDSPFLVDTASLAGSYADGALSISRFEIRTFDGAMTGTAVLGSTTGKSVSGELAFKHLNAARLSNALGFPQQLVGDMDGSLHFKMTGDAWTTLGASLDADGEFSISRGSVRGLDLSEAARRLALTPVLGGETKFETMSGKVRLTPSAWRVSELVLISGLMQSAGTIEISKDLSLSGRLELRTRGTANQARVPLLIGGTLRAPSVQADRRE